MKLEVSNKVRAARETLGVNWGNCNFPYHCAYRGGRRALFLELAGGDYRTCALLGRRNAWHRHGISPVTHASWLQSSETS